MMDIDQIRIALWILVGLSAIRTACQLMRVIVNDVCALIHKKSD